MGVVAGRTKIAILVFFIMLGVAIIYEGYSSSLENISPDPPVLFQKTMKPSAGAQTGILKINMTPTKAFVTGDVITADIEVDVFGIDWMNNETCNIDMTFPDAICYIDTWSNITYQDWIFTWWDYQSHDAVYAIYQEKVILSYVHDGYYGVNITVWEPNLGQFGYNKYYYSDLVQIKPYTYIEDAKRTQLAQGLNIEVLGLATIAIAPVLLQIVDSAKELSPPEKKE